MLWPGQFVRVRLRVPVQGSVLWVPAAAIGQSSDGPYVYVVGANLRAEQRHVTVVRTEGERAVLSGDIKVGERVVVDGQSRVIPGGAVALLAETPDGAHLSTGASVAVGRGP